VSGVVTFPKTGSAHAGCTGTPETLCESLRTILKHVYLFNSPGTKFLSTVCPSCKAVVFKREFYGPMGAKLKMEKPGLRLACRCPSCDTAINIRGAVASSAFQEAMFEGGYPFTRALEIIESILIAIGVTRRSEIAEVWDLLLDSPLFKRLHREIQAPDSFLELVSDIGRLAGRTEEAKGLAAYFKERLDSMSEGVRKAVKRPRVYYAMGKPWFSVNGDRMENSLVEFAGRDAGRHRIMVGPGVPAGPFGLTQ
jgi:pyruvate formate lyase activating enzyme